jgi:dienelactone hydrolase
MRTIKLVTCLFAVFFSQLLNAQNKTLLAKTDSIYSWFVNEKFEAIHQLFNIEMSRVLKVDELEATWSQIQVLFGMPIETKDKVVQKNKGLTLVRMPIKTDKSAMVLSLSFDSLEQVAGLFLSPGKINYTPPDYVDPEKFEERKIHFGAPNYAGTGILSLPKSSTKLPLILIVPGSGPVDKDLSIGSNKIYKDLAWGFASSGIAVFRYDKRTLNYQEKLIQSDASGEKFTVKNEYLEDLKAIFMQLKKRPEIDAEKIVLLGHSQGGYLIPLIHQKIKGFAGYISLAGTLREIPELAMEQVNYLNSLDATNSDTTLLASVFKQMFQSTRHEVVKMTSNSQVMGPYTLHYWQYLAKYNPRVAVLKIKQPILVLQGERDYQVPMKDFEIWKSTIGSKSNATFLMFPQLNHLFMAGEGAPNPSEYLTPGNVSKGVVEAIVKWVQAKFTQEK